MPNTQAAGREANTKPRPQGLSVCFAGILRCAFAPYVALGSEGPAEDTLVQMPLGESRADREGQPRLGACMESCAYVPIFLTGIANAPRREWGRGLMRAPPKQ